MSSFTLPTRDPLDLGPNAWRRLQPVPRAVGGNPPRRSARPRSLTPFARVTPLLAHAPASPASLSRSPRPFLNADESGRRARGYLEVEVLIERDRPAADPDPRSPCWPRGRRALPGGAAVVSYDGSAVPSLLSVGDLETGLALTDRGSQGEGDAGVDAQGGDDASFEVTCELVDGVTGKRYSLDYGGRLSDWQLGSPPRLDGWGPSRLGSAEAAETRGGARAGPGCGRLAKFVRLFRLEVPGEVRPWSAEDPQLYTVVVGLRPCAASAPWPGMDPGRPLSQFESARVGFRSVEVASGQLLVNGRAVMVAGVNRHEHDPITGKNVSEESMRGDILAMKRYGRPWDRARAPFRRGRSRREVRSRREERTVAGRWFGSWGAFCSVGSQLLDWSVVGLVAGRCLPRQVQLQRCP